MKIFAADLLVYTTLHHSDDKSQLTTFLENFWKVFEGAKISWVHLTHLEDLYKENNVIFFVPINVHQHRRLEQLAKSDQTLKI